MAETTAMTTSNPLGSVNLAACGCLWSQSSNPSIFIQALNQILWGPPSPDFPPRRTIFLWIQKVGLESHGWPLKKSFPLLETKMFQASFCCCKTPSACLPSSLNPRERSGFGRFSSCAKKLVPWRLGVQSCQQKECHRLQPSLMSKRKSDFSCVRMCWLVPFRVVFPF